jgi:glyoxylase I family protein
MNQTGKESTATSQKQHSSEAESFVKALRGVRYQVKDVSGAVAFYTKQLGFKLDQQTLPAFAQVSVGNLKLILSGPGASGSRPMPDGHHQEPGGWNRVVLQVTDLENRIETLKKAGLHFRNEMEAGPGGKQIQLEDPDGNPIELFEPSESQMKQESLKEAAVEFMSLVASGKVQEAYDRHVSRDFRHHNPYFRGDAQSLRTAMAENAEKNPNKTLDVQFALEDGDRVAVFSRITQNPGDRGGAVVHIFRFEGDRIAELWDVGQEIPANSVNENGMF